ncbi:IS3 family transposase [Bacillus sp. AFS018417]
MTEVSLYNTERFQEKPNHLSPIEYRTQVMKKCVTI